MHPLFFLKIHPNDPKRKSQMPSSEAKQAPQPSLYIRVMPKSIIDKKEKGNYPIWMRRMNPEMPIPSYGRTQNRDSHVKHILLSFI